jgi:GDP-4-dehydro-6-deoxy-D-mannose reductase
MTRGTVLVTGAGGFAGRHLVGALRATFPQMRIVGMDRALNVTDRENVLETFARLRPDFCVHLGAIAAVEKARKDPARAWAVNLHGTLNVADAILGRAPDCRLIFASSADCYGSSFVSGQPVGETAALAPMSVYAATKAAAELALGAKVAEGLRLLRLRLFNHTGPGQLESFVVPAFAGQIARIEAGLAPPEMTVGALHIERDFLDVRDVCAAYAACIERFDELPNNQVVNIASGQPVRIGAILNKLLARSELDIIVRSDPGKLRPAEIPRATGNAEKALTILSWKPIYSLDETLDAVLRYYRRAASAPANQFN